jgi:hypothetical protein
MKTMNEEFYLSKVDLKKSMADQKVSNNRSKASKM